MATAPTQLGVGRVADSTLLIHATLDGGLTETWSQIASRSHNSMRGSCAGANNEGGNGDSQ
jgi:hypothetical protein